MKLRTMIFNLERNKMVLTIKALWDLVIDHYFEWNLQLLEALLAHLWLLLIPEGKDSKAKGLHFPPIFVQLFFNTLSKCHPYRQKKQIVLIFFSWTWVELFYYCLFNILFHDRKNFHSWRCLTWYFLKIFLWEQKY